MFKVMVSMIAVSLILGCKGNVARAPGRYVDTFSYLGEKREYILHIPKSYDGTKPVPVVMALHGLTSNMNQMEASQFWKLGEKEGFITIFPNGIGTMRGWNCEFFAIAGSSDDVKLLGLILDKVESELRVDRKREYIFGHSNGAMMAFLCGSRLSGRLAAVAGISGTIGIPRNKTMPNKIPTPKSPIPVLLIHGMKDTIVGYKEGSKALLDGTGAEESAKWWAMQNSCSPKVVTDFGKYKVATYPSSTGLADVVLYSTKNGIHDIPGGYYGGGADKLTGINAFDEIWKFFSRQVKQ
jgi:polyhydroxybutyrate depolymerase